MGLSLGGLVQGAGSAYAGYGRGQIAGEQAAYQRQQQQEALQRQIAQQAIETQVANLQIQKAQREAADYPATHAATLAHLQSETAAQQADAALHGAQTTALTAKPTGPQKPWVKDGYEDSPAGRRQWIADKRSVAQATDTTPHNAPASTIETDATGNLVLVDPRTGAARPVTMNGQPVKGAPKGGAPKPTEGERRASGLLTGADEAWTEIQGLLDKGYDPLGESKLSRGVGVISRNTQRGMLSSEGKRFFNAAERLITNYLYTASGATANPGEVASQARQMTADMFDDPASMHQKLRFMQGKLDEMRAMAGSALPAGPTQTGGAGPGSGGARPTLDELFK